MTERYYVDGNRVIKITVCKPSRRRAGLAITTHCWTRRAVGGAWLATDRGLRGVKKQQKETNL